MCTLLMKKIAAFQAYLSLAEKKMLFKKLIASFTIALTVGLGAGGLTGSNAIAAPFVVLLESNANMGAGQEVFLVTYNSYADLISNNQASSTFSQLNINASYSVGGMAYDGSQFHVLLESNANMGAGQEVFLITYNSYADLISNNQASSTFSQLNINASYSAGGLTALNTGNGGNVVSEPATMMLVLIGLSFLSVFIRRKDDVCRQVRI